MEQTKRSPKIQLAIGVLQFLWAELKTMNMAKLKGLYKIATGYLAMKFSKKKPVQPKLKRRREFEEAAYRLSS